MNRNTGVHPHNSTFYDATSSEEFIPDLSFLDSKHPKYSTFRPTFFQTASKVHQLSLAAFGTTLLTIALTVGGIALFAGLAFLQADSTLGLAGAIITGIAGSGCSLCMFLCASAVLLRAKGEFWKDPTYCQERAEELMPRLIQGGYSQVCEEWKQEGDRPMLLSKDLIASTVQETFFNHEKWVTITADEKNPLGLLLRDGIFDTEIVKNQFRLELKDCEELSDVPNWQDLIELEIAKVEDFHDIAIQTFKNRGFVSTINWSLLRMGVVQPGEVSRYACDQFKSKGFQYMMGWCGNELFTEKVVSGQDPEVVESFTAYLKTRPDFMKFYETDRCCRWALDYDLIPQDYHEQLQRLATLYQDAINAKKDAVMTARQSHDQAVIRADEEFEKAIAEVKRPRTLAATRELVENRSSKKHEAYKVRETAITKLTQSLYDKIDEIQAEWQKLLPLLTNYFFKN